MAAKAEAGDKEAMTELLSTVKKHSAELAALEGEKPSMAQLAAYAENGCDKSTAALIAQAKASGCDKTAALASAAEGGCEKSKAKLIAMAKEENKEEAVN
jgi:hypothetical protein